MSEEHLTLRRGGHLRVRVASLVLMLLVVLPLAGTVSSQGDPSHIQLDSSRADRLDLNNDGDPDTARVVYLVNTSAHYAEAAVEVSAESGGMVLTFWDNFTFNRSTPRFGSIDIEAWGDGIYSVRIRVWDAETGMLVAMEELGELAECITKGKPQTERAEELADLLILTLGHAIAMDVDLEAAFDAKLAEVMQRPAIRGDLGVRVTRYEPPA